MGKDIMEGWPSAPDASVVEVTPFFTSGSSKLDPEQQAFYVKRFGVRYIAVEQMPYTASRKERRKRRFRPRSER